MCASRRFAAAALALALGAAGHSAQTADLSIDVLEDTPFPGLNTARLEITGGPANGIALPIAGLGTTAGVFIPGIGTLFLDPATLFLNLPSFGLDVSGNGFIDLPYQDTANTFTLGFQVFVVDVFGPVGELTSNVALAHGEGSVGCSAEGWYDDSDDTYEVTVKGVVGFEVEIFKEDEDGNRTKVKGGTIGVTGELTLSGTVSLGSDDKLEVECQGSVILTLFC